MCLVWRCVYVCLSECWISSWRQGVFVSVRPLCVLGPLGGLVGGCTSGLVSQPLRAWVRGCNSIRGPYDSFSYIIRVLSLRIGGLDDTRHGAECCLHKELIEACQTKVGIGIRRAPIHGRRRLGGRP